MSRPPPPTRTRSPLLSRPPPEEPAISASTDARPPRRRARRGEGEHLRAEILDAATRLLVDSGDEHAVSIRAVADAVGVTPPSIYLHFADKDALLYAVCEEQFKGRRRGAFGAGFSDAMDAAVAGVADPVERLRRRGRSYVEWALANPELYRILFMRSAAYQPDDFDFSGMLADSGFGDLFADVAAAAEQGRVAFPPLQAARLLWASVHGVASLMIAKPDFPWDDRDALVDDLLTMVQRGVFHGSGDAGAP